MGRVNGKQIVGKNGTIDYFINKLNINVGKGMYESSDLADKYEMRKDDMSQINIIKQFFEAFKKYYIKLIKLIND